MAAQRLELISPSGGRVRIALPDDRPVSTVAAAVRFAGGSYGTGFQIGPRGYHQFACTYVAPAVTRDRLLVHGREVVVAEANDRQSSVATLIGAHHELMTVYAGPAPGSDRVSALFTSLEITDHAEGMVVRPRAATLLDTMTEQVAVVVRGRGTVSIPGPRQALALVPKHPGAPTRYGEVWKVALPDTNGRYSFVLGTPAGLAEVHLTDPGGLDWLAEIDVAWHD
jgi:hypothetical protein